MNKHYIKKAVTYSTVGSLGFAVVAALQGCGDTGLPPAEGQNQSQSQISDAAAEGLFMVIQQTGENPDTFELAEKYPSGQGTRAILKGMDGSERILSEEELKQMAEAEAQRVESGESQLAQPEASSQGGLSLGETILASAAGALIGGMLANKLMGNSNFNRNQQAVNQKAQRTMSSTRKPASNTANKSNSSKRSGFFGGNKGGSRSGGSLGG
uniref:FIG01388762: membrane lipoprotein n=1 Tax=uncultured Thiotrichaceae bacterium TaxID=298394 RepID=A0A6S6U0V9_9GAMM|nr:MAG: FIG01388762: membrane lipoprotein [uncultured Thiotrichaceae bacterium]